MPDAMIHPTPQELTAFGLGKLPERAAAVVAAHLGVCPACRQAVAGVTSDSFLDKVRAASPGGSSFPPNPPRPVNALSSVGQQAATTPYCPNLPPELANHPKYRILRELGRGGMGVVYQARQTGMMDRQVVIKVINRALLDNPDALERFLREVQAAAQLSHPNVVTAYDAEQAGELRMLVMEFVPGQNLAEVLAKKGPLPVATACHYARQAAWALQHAHERGMVHRDIKPQNLMLTPKGQVKVLDFGLAKVVSERGAGAGTGLTSSNSYMGTPEYSAPEQATDARSADIRADLYSLGCTLYCLLVGWPPFREDTAMKTILAHLQQQPQSLLELRPDVPERLWGVVARLLAKEPGQRYQKPLEVVQALAPFVKAGAKPEAKSGPAPAAGSPEKGTMIRADTNKVKRILREVPGKADTRGVLSEDEKRLLRAETLAVPAGAAQASMLGDEAATDAVWSALDANKANAVEARPGGDARRRRPAPWRGCLVGAATVAVLLLGLLGLWAGGVFTVKTANGTIVLENVPADAEVLVDGAMVSLKTGDGKTITIDITAEKKHQLRVKKEGFKVFGEEVEIDAGNRRAIRVRLQPEPTMAKARPALVEQPRNPSPDPKTQPQNPAPDSETHPQYPAPAEDKGFVPLFNGKDLTGWQVLLGTPNDSWTVENGAIGSATPGWTTLGTKLLDYGEFHLRAETMLTDGEGALFQVCARWGEEGATSYVVNINSSDQERTPDTPKTGSLCRGHPGRAGGRPVLQVAQDVSLKPGEWFLLEVIVTGNRVRVLVKGKLVVDYTDNQAMRKQGRILLTTPPGTTTARFRKIEIKELK